MLTFHALYLNQYKNLIEDALKRHMEVLQTNHAIPDFPSYKHQLGVIEGLKLALELSDEADAIANGREEQGV